MAQHDIIWVRETGWTHSAIASIRTMPNHSVSPRFHNIPSTSISLLPQYFSTSMSIPEYSTANISSVTQYLLHRTVSIHSIQQRVSNSVPAADKPRSMLERKFLAQSGNKEIVFSSNSYCGTPAGSIKPSASRTPVRDCERDCESGSQWEPQQNRSRTVASKPQHTANARRTRRNRDFSLALARNRSHWLDFFSLVCVYKQMPDFERSSEQKSFLFHCSCVLVYFSPFSLSPFRFLIGFSLLV